jgi:hypothetical protein
MAFQVDADYVRARILPTLIGPTGKYPNVISRDEIQALVDEEKAKTQEELSTRFEITEFRGWMGPGVRPDDVLAVPPTPPDDPGHYAIEYEGPYMWPSMSPGSGYLEFRLNYRPIHQIYKGQLVLPGTTAPGIDIISEWMRTNSIQGTGTLMPRYGMSALILPNLPFGLFQFMKTRIPDAINFNYEAGMGVKEWRMFPFVNRLVALKAAIPLLRTLSLRINPGGLTSQSADGLSISRKSGYVFEEIHKAMSSEAEELKMKVIDHWDGTSEMTIC